jgi:predicted amidophosphoribosyltransferase
MLKKCIWCGKLFETSDGRIKRCPQCYEEPTPHITKKPKTSKKKKVPTIQEMMHIAAVYDFIKGARILNHYGNMADIIKNSNPGVCVCCGNKAPKYSYVCLECEEKYKIKKAGGAI